MFPRATGLKYEDDGENIMGVVTLREGQFLPPSSGWDYPSRTYLVVKGMSMFTIVINYTEVHHAKSLFLTVITSS